MGNVLHTIKPYWHVGAWVFDDPHHRLLAKPFVGRNPEIVDKVLRQAGLQPRQAFAVTFGDYESPGLGYQFVLEWVREDHEGHWYQWGGMEGLCLALLRYFGHAPKCIHCLVTLRKTPFSVMRGDQGEGMWWPAARDMTGFFRRTR